ncbi:MAG: uroporphyrinogen decarboxylase [Sandaracinaceae bacterium]
MSDDAVFLRACRREPVPHTPIWLMRQAGRYQASYQAIRAKVDFVGLCKSPELACQVTVDAVDQLGVDAAILFADILLILEPLQIGFRFEAGEGPTIDAPVRDAEAIDAIPDEIDPNAELGYVMDAVRLIRRALGDRTPLIGFAASPFTLASYAIEGGGSRDYHHTKQLMYGDPGAWHALMGKLSRAIASYLNAQVDAGAQAVQLFDSWVGALNEADYRRYVFPYVEAIFDRISGRVPTIHFGQGNPELYGALKEAGGDVISVDWRVRLDDAWSRLGDGVGIQGNMDPTAILGPREVMFEHAKAVLDQAGGRNGHIFNLGHGILRWSTVDQVKALVDYVHETSAR